MRLATLVAARLNAGQGQEWEYDPLLAQILSGRTIRQALQGEVSDAVEEGDRDSGLL